MTSSLHGPYLVAGTDCLPPYLSPVPRSISAVAQSRCQTAGGSRRREAFPARPALETHRPATPPPEAGLSGPHPTIRPQPGILDIALYVGGESKLAGHNRVLKLSSNENPFGASPATVEAFRAAAASLHLYPDTTHASLRAAIARVHGLDAGRIVCGAGSDEIIAFLCQVYAGPGLEVIHTEHGFGMYRISALAAGATPVEVPRVRPPHRRRRDSRCLHRAHRPRLHRQPQQPDRHDDRRDRGRPAGRRPAARRPSSSSTAPMPSTSRVSTATPASSPPATTR